MKQTKTVKFIFALMLLIPVALFFTGIVQSFVLKHKKNEFNDAKKNLQQQETVYEEKEELYNYLTSDEYIEQYYMHEGYENDQYGNSGDININVVVE